MSEVLNTEEPIVEEQLPLVLQEAPVKVTRGRKKKVRPVEGEIAENQEVSADMRHIDAVFKKSTYDLINKIVQEEELPTRSALMREAVEFYLNFKVVAEPDDVLLVVKKNGEQRFAIPIRMIV